MTGRPISAAGSLAEDDSDATALIDLIYEAALDGNAWVGVMESLARRVRGGSVAYIKKDLLTGRGAGLYSGIDAASFNDYFGHYASRNPLARSIRTAAPGTILLDWQSVSKTELMRSEYYNDFLRPRRMHGILGVLLWRQDSASAILNITRTPEQGDFLPQDAAAIRPFLPHIRRSVELTARLPVAAAAGSGFELLAAGLRDGVLLLDVTGRLIYANAAAERVLRRQDGLVLRGQTLHAREPADEHRLARLLAGAVGLGASGGSVTVPRRDGGVGGYAVRVMPCPERQAMLPGGMPGMIVTISDPAAAIRCPDEQLRELFGLTPAQAVVAGRLADGCSMGSISAELGISTNTARRHLADVMAKTATRRQAELVRLLVQLPV